MQFKFKITKLFFSCYYFKLYALKICFQLNSPAKSSKISLFKKHSTKATATPITNMDYFNIGLLRFIRCIRCKSLNLHRAGNDAIYPPSSSSNLSEVGK